MADTLIRIGDATDDTPEGLASVETLHYRPDTLPESKRERFDRRLDLPHPPRVEGHQTKLFADPATKRVAWYTRRKPDEEGGDPGPWQRLMDVDLGS